MASPLSPAGMFFYGQGGGAATPARPFGRRPVFCFSGELTTDRHQYLSRPAGGGLRTSGAACSGGACNPWGGTSLPQGFSESCFKEPGGGSPPTLWFGWSRYRSRKAGVGKKTGALGGESSQARRNSVKVSTDRPTLDTRGLQVSKALPCPTSRSRKAPSELARCTQKYKWRSRVDSVGFLREVKRHDRRHEPGCYGKRNVEGFFEGVRFFVSAPGK